MTPSGYIRGKLESLTSESIPAHVDDIHGSDSLSASMLSEGDSISDDVLKEDQELELLHKPLHELKEKMQDRNNRNLIRSKLLGERKSRNADTWDTREE